MSDNGERAIWRIEQFDGWAGAYKAAVEAMKSDVARPRILGPGGVPV